jgi:hypothetical protein
VTPSLPTTAGGAGVRSAGTASFCADLRGTPPALGPARRRSPPNRLRRTPPRPTNPPPTGANFNSQHWCYSVGSTFRPNRATSVLAGLPGSAVGPSRPGVRGDPEQKPVADDPRTSPYPPPVPSGGWAAFSRALEPVLSSAHGA